MTFQDKLAAIVAKNNSLVCVGLDSDIRKTPEHIDKTKGDFQFQFNKKIIDVTHDLVCAYKINTAFYERNGEEGIRNLHKTTEYLHKKYKDILIILDAKRGDIGNTNIDYVTFAFDWLEADAITVYPYLGQEALQVFFNHKEKTTFVLCRTSNPGAGEFQDLEVNGKPLYQIVAQHVAENWNTNGNCGLVVGATYPNELSAVRKIVGDMILLVPGVGAQEGDIEKTVKAGLNSKGAGMIINSSRGIIFASSGQDFAERAREEGTKLRDLINRYR